VKERIMVVFLLPERYVEKIKPLASEEAKRLINEGWMPCVTPARSGWKLGYLGVKPGSTMTFYPIPKQGRGNLKSKDIGIVRKTVTSDWKSISIH
jgi:hypothetical protein